MIPIQAPSQEGIFGFGLKTGPRTPDLLLDVRGGAPSNSIPVTTCVPSTDQDVIPHAGENVQGTVENIHKVVEMPEAINSELVSF